MSTLTLLCVLAVVACSFQKDDRGDIIVAFKFEPYPQELIILKPPFNKPIRHEIKGIEGQYASIRLNPAGTHVFLLSNYHRLSEKGFCSFGYIIDLDKPDQPVTPILEKQERLANRASWSPDGTKIYFSDYSLEELISVKMNESVPYRSWCLDVKTKVKTAVNLPLGHKIVDLSKDGKLFLTAQGGDFGSVNSRAFLVPLDGLKPKLVSDVSCLPENLSPDSKIILGKNIQSHFEPPGTMLLFVENGKFKILNGLPRDPAIVHPPTWNQKGDTLRFWRSGTSEYSLVEGNETNWKRQKPIASFKLNGMLCDFHGR